MNKIAEIKGVHKTYDTGKFPTPALRGIDLEIKQGTFNCLVGPSGHGKSTLLHLIGGLDRPTQGTVKVMGEVINELHDSSLARFRARKLGFVFQFFNLLRGLTALENVQLPMMYSQTATKDQLSRAKELLSRVGLAEKLESKINHLSGGQMQRVAIARALANNPQVLLLDEPTGNLDSVSEREILDLIHNLHQEGKTIIMVTHNMEIAESAQRIIKIKDGKIA